MVLIPNPLTHTQRQLWLAERMGKGRNVYGVHVVIELLGHLDHDLVGRCVTEIVRRHEPLRARIVEHDAEPGLVVEAPMPVPIEVWDLRESPESAETVIMAAARAPIDLTEAPLIRVLILDLGADRHVLLLNIHHIAFDGWSLRVFWEEFVELYSAWAEGKQPTLRLPRTSYRGSARQRAELRNSGAFRDQLRYWEHELANPPHSDVFPRDLPTPAARRNQASALRVELPRELYTKLKVVARALRATAFAVTLSAWSVVLSRWSGRNDLLIGSPLAGRTLPGEDELIGVFLNMVPLRIQLDQSARFTDLVTQVRAKTLGALENQDVAGEIAERPRQNGSAARLFRTMFSYEDAPRLDSAPPGLRVAGLREVTQGFASFDLGAVLLDAFDSLCVQFEYDVDLFSETTITRLADRFVHVLANALDRPDSRLRDLRGVSDTELRELHGMSGDPVWPEPDLTVHGLFEDRARRTPEAHAVAYRGERMTYAALNSEANRLAHHLRSLGVEPEVPVAIALPKGPRWAVAILAVLKAGGAYVPVVPTTGRERVERVLADAAPALVVTDSAAGAGLGDGFRAVLLDDPATRRLLTTSPAANPGPSATGANLAYVPYTSGSTGRPKGILVSHTNLVSFTRAAVAKYGLTERDAFIQLAAMSFDVHVEELVPVWLAGGTVVFSDIDLSRTLPAELFAELAAHGATVCELTTAYWHELVRSLSAERLDRPPRLRLVLVGGELIPVAAYRRWEALNVPLVNVYGLTETAVTSTTYDAGQRSAADWLPVGRPMAHASLYVLDDALHQSGVGNVGAVFIGGPGISRGLLGQPAATAARFLPDPFSAVAGARMYRTGDTGRWLSDGNLEFLGRIDDQVKIRGHRVEPNEVVAALQEHPDVHQSAVVVDRSDPGCPRLLAYLVGDGIDEHTLSQYARAKLPEHLVPARMVVLDALPLTGHGKVDHNALPPPGEPVRPRTGEPAGTPVQRRLAEIYRDVLAVPSMGITESIFTRGGHSLLALRLISKVQQEFSVKVPIVDFFVDSTIATLSRLIETAAPAE